MKHLTTLLTITLTITFTGLAQQMPYNPDANVDNGTCLPAISMGCVINFACNYDPAATAYVPGACDFSCLYGMPWSGN